MTRRFPFQYLQRPGVEDGATPFPGLLHFTLDPYIIVLSAKQGSVKYQFLSLRYDSTWDWTVVSRTIGEHSTHEDRLKNKISKHKDLEIEMKKYNTSKLPRCQ